MAAYGLIAAATQLLWVTYAPITDDAAKHFGVSSTTIGWLAQVFPLFYVLLAIPAGVVLDRYFRGGLILGAVLTGLGGLLRLVSDDFTWALIGQSVAAVGEPFILNAITGLSVGYLASQDRANGIATASAATFAGLAVGFLLGALLPGVDRVQTVVLVSALIAVAAALVATFAVLRRPPAGLDSVAARSGGFAAVRVAWRDRYLRRLCAVVFIPFGTFIALATYAQPLLEPAGVSVSTAGVVLLLNVVAGVVGCAVLPVWADRRGREVSVIAIGVVVTAVACVLLAVAPGVVTAYVALSAIGLVLLPALPIVLSLTEKRAGEAESTAAGLIWMSGTLGGFLIATVAGVLVNQPTAAFLVLGVITLGTLPLLSWFHRHVDDPAVL
ncbi:MFS transporter [Marmoricola sp. URHB0036]|uniref:MFS transporter n=1 Tax=Marmoricola sp. URHB0036 TaxID=1298863 RepID=UPI0003F8B5D3|nr:MFS transporter [Marmoricola sp. URHB0036]